MDASYFYVLVLPLGIFVFLLASLAFYYARKEELAERKWRELANARVEKQLGDGDGETLNKQLKGLEKLLENKSIDQITYERLKKVLEDDYKMNMELDCSEKEAAYSVT